MLTESKIRKLAIPAKEELFSFGNCLYLRHRTTGRKTFIIRRRVGAKMTSTSLGDWPAWTIQRAKDAANAPSQPLAERVTFGVAAGRFITEMLEARYRGDTSRYAASFTRDAASLYATPLHRITRSQMVDLVMKKHATAPSAAKKQLAIYKQFTKWAAMRELLPGDILSPVSAAGIGLDAYRPRERTLTPDEIRQVMTSKGSWWPLMRLSLATATRIGEAMGYAPEQAAGDVWTIPETKNGKPHSVHLTAIAKTAIAEGWPGVHYATVNRWLRREGVEWNPHDLRRTAATLMRKSGVSREDVETVLNHSPGQLVQVYQRHSTLPVIKVALEALERELVNLSV